MEPQEKKNPYRHDKEWTPHGENPRIKESIFPPFFSSMKKDPIRLRQIDRPEIMV